MEGDEETERTVVKTYVPRYQKEVWREQADALDMSQSEFVRAMVQAGRHVVDGEEPGSAGGNPGGDGLEMRVEGALSGEGHVAWKELRDRLVADFEERLETTLRELQNGNRIEHSGRHGGYALSDDE